MINMAATTKSITLQFTSFENCIAISGTARISAVTIDRTMIGLRFIVNQVWKRCEVTMQGPFYADKSSISHAESESVIQKSCMILMS